MSDRIPQFKPGDRVRIMPTDEMARANLANKRGTVLASLHGASLVVFDSYTATRQRTETIPNHSLMRVEA